MADNNLEVDLNKLRVAIKSGIPLVITTYTLPHDMEIYMSNVTSAFFHELQQDHMIQYVIYSQNELITNAKKANTKRIYFKEKELDVNNQKDYDEGMKTFKSETLSNINYYLVKQKQAGLYVKLILQYRNNKIRIEVHNNSTLTYFEYKRIHDKISRAQKYQSVEETMSKILDDSEGAGLGLIIMILMLKKLGMNEDNFQTLCENGITKTRIILPLSKEVVQHKEIVSSEIKESIQNLPQFPEDINRLNKLLNDPNSKISDIAINISKNVTLTGELLKLVNSSAMGLSQKCGNIVEAVKFVGLRGIKNMLFTIGSLKILTQLQGSSEELWEYSYKVAFYAYNFAKNLSGLKDGFVEDAYLCGLLHDMGKIVFEGSYTEFIEKVKGVCEKKGVDALLFEKVLSGVDHAELGAQIAEKWNFPQDIIHVIRYHHCPSAAPDNVKNLVDVVYIADMMVLYQKGDVDYYQIDPEVLIKFRITNELQFDKIGEKIAASFSM